MNEFDLFLFFLDRIYRIDWIFFSRRGTVRACGNRPMEDGRPLQSSLFELPTSLFELRRDKTPQQVDRMMDDRPKNRRTKEDRCARMRDDRRYPPSFPSRSVLRLCAFILFLIFWSSYFLFLSPFHPSSLALRLSFSNFPSFPTSIFKAFLILAIFPPRSG